MRNSKVEQVNKFLQHTKCRTLILNGDIIDAWSLKPPQRNLEQALQTVLIRLILKKIEKKKTKVIYLRGNHDDVLRKFMPIHFDGFRIVEDYTLLANGRKYLVLHGDVFDRITSKYAMIAHLGDIGYQLLLGINRLYNRYRSWKGKRYYSLSKLVKRKVKKAVNFIGKFESSLVGLAKHHGCDGVICGHIHTAEDKMLDDIHYLNSGDWVESLTAIVEHVDGRLRLIDYPHLRKSSWRRQNWPKKPSRITLGGSDRSRRKCPCSQPDARGEFPDQTPSVARVVVGDYPDCRPPG